MRSLIDMTIGMSCSMIRIDEPSSRWIERMSGPNATYKGAWDVGAAGYIDPEEHQDPEAIHRTSCWRACAAEITQELNIPQSYLQNREHYRYFGVGRNEKTDPRCFARCRHLLPRR